MPFTPFRAASSTRSDSTVRRGATLLALAVMLPLADAAAQPTAAHALACDRYVANPARQPSQRAVLQAATRGGNAAAAAFAQGCLASAEGRWDAAAKAFERAVAAHERSAPSHYWLGRSYAVQVQRANILRQAALAGRVRSHLERAVELDPDHIDARGGLMMYYLRAPRIAGGSKVKAREQVEEVRRRNAYRGGLLAASFARRDDRVPDAIAEYERLIAQYPDSAQPYSSLASTYGDQRRWAEAFATVQRFRAALPAEPLAGYALGRAAAESGQQLDAGEAGLRRYIASAVPAPGEPTIATAHLRLGRIFEHRRQTEQARAEYRTALRLEPTLEEAREALGKLR